MAIQAVSLGREAEIAVVSAAGFKIIVRQCCVEEFYRILNSEGLPVACERSKIARNLRGFK